MYFSTVQECEEYVELLLNTMQRVKQLDRKYTYISDNGTYTFNGKYYGAFSFSEASSLGGSSADLNNGELTRYYYHSNRDNDVEFTNETDDSYTRYDHCDVPEIVTDEWMFQQSTLQDPREISVLMLTSILRKHKRCPSFLSVKPHLFDTVLDIISEMEKGTYKEKPDDKQYY